MSHLSFLSLTCHSALIQHFLIIPRPSSVPTFFSSFLLPITFQYRTTCSCFCYPPPSPSNTHPIHPPTPSLYLSTRLSLSSSFIQSAFPHPLVLPSLFPTTSLRQPILAQAGAGPQCRGRGVPSGWQLQPRSRCPLRSRVPSATGPLRHGGCYG